MPQIELRAPRRKIERQRDLLIPILLATVTVGGLGYVAMKKIDRAAAMAVERKAEEAKGQQRSHDAEIAQRRQSALRQQQLDRLPDEAPLAAVTTQSGRTYYVPPTSGSRSIREPTVQGRYERASRLMSESRQVQRQIDSAMYGGDGIIDPDTSAASTTSSYTCASLRRRKEILDERMRRYGYGNYEAEMLHQDWRDINKAMVANHCH